MNLARVSMAALAAALLMAPLGAAPAAAQAATAQSPSQQLAALFAASDETNLRLNPLSALSRGDMRYADRLGDYFSDASYEAARQAARRELAALARIDRRQMTARRTATCLPRTVQVFAATDGA